MKRNILLVLYLASIILGLFSFSAAGGSFPENPYEQVFVSEQDTLPPIEERYGDFFTTPHTNPFDLHDPSAIEQTIEYDPKTDRYILTETIGDELYRPTTYMTFDEYIEWSAKKQEKNYFDELSGVSTGEKGKSVLDPMTKIDVSNLMKDRLFGNPTVEIKPQGNIDLTFGVDYQKIDNPNLLLRQRQQTGFDFDMDIRMNVTGKIGDKLSLTTNYSSNATFDFDKQLKLDYDSDLFSEDDIIKKIEAGNVSLPLRGSLIQGNQSLFGLKTELQFGRLRLSAVASQQQSERKNLEIQGGSQVQEFEVKADEYDENRHFFLSHYNRDVFEDALSDLPQIKGLFRIKNIQVWLTNDRRETQDVVDIVALTDLGEASLAKMTSSTPVIQPPANAVFKDIKGLPLPDNRANPLYDMLLENQAVRKVDKAVSVLQSAPFNLQAGRDFEKISARRLSASEFTYHPELGFISVNVNVQPDQVLAVAYEYSYKDTILRVGEFADDIPPMSDSLSTRNLVFVKMLKSSSQRVDVPSWDLMMKNIYSIGAYQVNREDFRLDIYYEDPGKGEKRFLPKPKGGTQPFNLEGEPLLRVFNLDQLNVQGDPHPDGVFDFVENVTINTRNGRIMFPVLEPFGDALAKKINVEAYRKKFVYDTLYSSTLTTARQYAYLNRFTIKGSYKSSVSSEISLGAFNIPEGSVRVSAGGHLLEEGKDYEIDYSIGRVKILNDAYLNSGQPVRVSFEDNALFGFKKKALIGLRADYEVNKHLNIGGTYLHLFERPYTNKVNVGDDPINNRIFGLDVNYSKPNEWLTKLVDKIPLIQTKVPSNITFTAEGAYLKPGHARAINENKKDREGVVYIDDFEGSVSGIPLGNQVTTWKLASTPHNDAFNSNPMFPEADQVGTLFPGVNRAKLSWYRIDPSLLKNDDDNKNPYTARIDRTEVFPNYTPTGYIESPFLTFDMTYYPDERGPYNFDSKEGTPYSNGVQIVTVDSKQKIKLKDPETRWAGITHALTHTNDFEASNVEYIEFWMLSPFLNEDGSGDPNPDADQMEGDLYFNLGSISEDILPDSRLSFENGLPAPSNPNRPTDKTVWGVVPRSQAITNAFDTEARNRSSQDVGLDGMGDAAELEHFKTYVTNINLPAVNDDPANDNFVGYRDESVFSDNTPVIDRYFDFNNPQNNSPIRNTNNINENSNFSSLPDSEDLNGDNSLNESEAYFQYRVPIKHDGQGGIDLNNPFITDNITSASGDRTWYRFKIPLELPEDNPYFTRVGGIRDFRSIKYMRMYMKNFKKKITLRFARMELVRNQWRRYKLSLNDGNFGIEGREDNTAFDVNSVGIVENSQKVPVNYVLPPGIKREQAIGGVNQNALQDERSLSMTVCNLNDGDARAIYKILNLDMRVFEGLKMFVHAEKGGCDNGVNNLKDGDLRVFVRLGSDFTKNYYEYELPLTITDETELNGADVDTYARLVWPESNKLQIDFSALKDLKVARNKANAPLSTKYPESGKPVGRGLVRIIGNPNLGLVKGVMVGVRNPLKEFNESDDTGEAYDVEVWVNELRAFGLDEKGGGAALARLDMQLADFANVTLAGNYSSIGYGGLDQKLIDRSQDELFQYDFTANMELGKFFGDKSGVKIPFYSQYSKMSSSPRYDPYDLDIELDRKLSITEASKRDSVREQAQKLVTIKSFNFTNVHKERTDKNAKPKPWDISNFSLNYSYSQTKKSDPIIERDVVDKYQGGINYNYSRSAKFIKPFKKLVKKIDKKDKYAKFISDFNFNPLPNSFKFSTLMTRQFAETKYRFVGGDPYYNTFYIKDWKWDRRYDLNWDFAKSLKFNFSAVNSSIIDELPEFDEETRQRTDAQLKKDYALENIKNFGRTKNYNHNFSINYTLPFKKFIFLNWMKATATYSAEYAWNASSESSFGKDLGNVIQNRQARQISGDLDFVKLYNKSKFLKKINKPSRRGKGKRKGAKGKDADKGKKSAKNKSVTDEKKPGKKSKKKKDTTPSLGSRIALRPLMMLRKIRLSYSESFSTVVPGYMPRTRIIGMDDGFTSPGWAFVAGLQPDMEREHYYSDNDWLYSNSDWISRSVYLNQQVDQRYSQDFSGKVSIEPVPDFKIDVDFKRNYTRNHSEDFRMNREGADSSYMHLNSQVMGSFSTTYYSMNTLFEKDINSLFNDFQENRLIIAQRLGTGIHQDSINKELGYPAGYGRYQQNVLLPAFLAAYTDKNPRTMEVSDNYFNLIKNRLPRPNWKVTYDGLSKIPLFKNLFKNFKISHSYKSVLNINNYGSDLSYDYDNPLKLKETTLDYFSRYEIPALVIDEKFAPLLGVNIKFQNDMTFKIDYNKGRNLQMNFNSYRLSETKTTQFVVGFGQKVKNVHIGFLDFGDKLNFKKKKKGTAATGSKKKKRKKGKKSGKGHDLDLKVDFAYRDDITLIYVLDQEITEPTRGTKSISFSPSAEYKINDNLSLRLFFDYRKTVPKVSSSYPITNAKGGIVVRFMLN